MCGFVIIEFDHDCYHKGGTWYLQDCV